MQNIVSELLVAVTSFTLKGACSRAKGVSCIFKVQFKGRTMALPPYDGTVLCGGFFFLLVFRGVAIMDA